MLEAWERRGTKGGRKGQRQRRKEEEEGWMEGRGREEGGIFCTYCGKLPASRQCIQAHVSAGSFTTLNFDREEECMWPTPPLIPRLPPPPSPLLPGLLRSTCSLTVKGGI